MKWRLLIACTLTVTIVVSATSVFAATNETVEVEAKEKDNPQQNDADIEGYFQDPPTGDKDEIHVSNGKGKAAGVYNDPVNDGAALTIVQIAGPVKVDVEGREGVGSIYWVTVGPDGGGDGGGAVTELWADVEDKNVAGALVLKDTNTGAGKSDSTDPTDDTPTLYCTAPLTGGTGSVEIRLNADSGTYDWCIEGEGSSYYESGVFDGPYTIPVAGIAPGTYVLTVTDDSTFCRVINFVVIEIGQYLPASYPESEISSDSAGESNPFYYSEGGKIRSISVSAPIDGDEQASNPYEYDVDYTITIDPDDGTATVEFQLPGVYMLRIERDYGGVVEETYQTLFYEAAACSAPVAAKWPTVLILAPHWTFNLVHNGGDDAMTYGFAGAGLVKAKFDSWNGAAATSVESLVQTMFAANGNNPFDLTILAHGDPGHVLGDVMLNQYNVAASLGDKIAGKVKRIRFYSCRIGEIPGFLFLQNLKTAANATEVSGYVDYVFITDWPYIYSAGSWGNKTVQ